MVGVVELQTIAINEADGSMRAKQRDREHFQKITTDLHGRTGLRFWFRCRQRGTLVLISADPRAAMKLLNPGVLFLGFLRLLLIVSM